MSLLQINSTSWCVDCLAVPLSVGGLHSSWTGFGQQNVSRSDKGHFLEEASKGWYIVAMSFPLLQSN